MRSCRWRNLQQVDEFDSPRDASHIEARQGNGQAETAGAGAAGIDVEDSAALNGFRLVGMAADDGTETGGARVKRELFDIVEDEDLAGGGGFGEGRGPWRRIDVPADGDDGCNRTQSPEDRGATDVAGVEDQVRTFERAQGFGAQKTVRV